MRLYVSYAGQLGPTVTLKMDVDEDWRVSALLERFVEAYKAKTQARHALTESSSESSFTVTHSPANVASQ